MTPNHLSVAPVQYLTLDPAFHVREDIWQQERRATFARTWQFMGPASAVTTPGQYLAIDIAGSPVLAIRGRDGTLRGFRNVCRHRGAKLLADGTGECGLIVCPYHKWSFADTGRLVQAPWFGRDPAIIPENWPLDPVHLSGWCGLLFAALDLSVVREDIQICAETHCIYAAGAYTSDPLSGRHEKGVRYFQQQVAAALGL